MDCELPLLIHANIDYEITQVKFLLTNQWNDMRAVFLSFVALKRGFADPKEDKCWLVNRGNMYSNVQYMNLYTHILGKCYLYKTKIDVI